MVTPSDFGEDPVDLAEIKAAAPEVNGRISRSLLDGDGPSAVVITITINAVAVIYLSGEAPDLLSGAERAQESIRSGAARESIKDWFNSLVPLPDVIKNTIHWSILNFVFLSSSDNNPRQSSPDSKHHTKSI